ncbi:hypothetical protein FHQ08_11910 [Lactobacillus sp. CC-MHH1034]|uniref:hypothetical protein n=1 Tax=Agrilactobacillus fermenti TaxID=2586909 RepID=UPI001E3CCBBD|nr:hypothetical protein [Agrilactobacillus fermenti]MCD2257391.1 hypothetical protein [Agrilactobacillus fermenti]
MDKEQLIDDIMTLRDDKPRRFWELHSIQFLKNVRQVEIERDEHEAEEAASTM